MLPHSKPDVIASIETGFRSFFYLACIFNPRPVTLLGGSLRVSSYPSHQLWSCIHFADNMSFSKKESKMRNLVHRSSTGAV